MQDLYFAMVALCRKNDIDYNELLTILYKIFNS